MVTGLTEDVTGDNGERIELACLVDSNPRPNITWTRPGHSQVRQLQSGKIFGRLWGNKNILQIINKIENSYSFLNLNLSCVK